MVEEPQVCGNLRRDAGTSDLEDDGRSARQFGPVHLRYRRGGMRLTLNIGKHLKRGAAERLFNLWEELVERNRCHLAVQTFKLGNPARRKEVWACREHLAKLYECRPELLQGATEALL